MPTHDGGHYFLTVFAPIRTDTVIDPIVGRSRSHEHSLAQKLALLPTGRQTEASPADALASPFAGNTLNHFARFVIIDGPQYNGRVSGDTLIGVVKGVNPLVPQPVDRLRTPYLMFAADIDAPGDGEAALSAYTDRLWATMGEDLHEIFGHCAGFVGVDGPEAFHAYIKKCQIETNLPFNDYWADDLKFKPSNPPIWALKAVAVAAGVAMIAWLLALLVDGVLVALGRHTELARRVAAVTGWGVVIIVAALLVTLLAAYGAYRYILWRGMQPFATAPGSDLPTVLKSLFIQQHFVRFAIAAQALDDTQLYARFGAFLDAVQPTSARPTQRPGEIRADGLAL